MHCPNCNAVITKVVLRKKRTKKGLSATPPQPEPVDLLGCLSCCSVFVPSGKHSATRYYINCYNIPQQTNILQSGSTGNDGNMVIDKEGNGTSVGEEPQSLPGIIQESRGEIPTRLTGTGDSKSLEIVKSIVYGGLMEFITSLSIVTSAAASGATMLNLLTIGLANLIGGLIIIGHNLWDLKSDQCEGASNKYQEQLGKKENFLLHATFAVLSFLVFGLIPPATYGYAFEQMNDQNLTLGAVAIASLLCIIILASCKAYIMKSEKLSMYIKTIMYYVCIALMVSGISYEAGDLINKLMENYGWFEKTSAFPLSLPGASSRINRVPWTSY
ncbi:hypothetical protein DCAR_0105154 [Daucus carota subsp. sativus]|uniref:Membrane protein of ER body-like protein n=1 Tax=Daucus carota subsp. sativus TaxID=79200 RepID=A0AAF0WBW7_DAUCS|nr:hypothetical protein DCAR_0105154 [Daucus carota subsp. sativus]